MSIHPQTARYLRDAAIIFLAATVLGLAFNATSPLGVRTEPHAAAKSSATPPPAHSEARGIQNETLSITIGAAPSAPLLAGQPPATVTWPEAKALLPRGDAVLVDAREPQAFAAGHIPGAITLPMGSFNERIADFAAKYPKGKTIIVYCASSQCSISRTLAQLLIERHGYTDVRDMTGGFAEWRLAETAAPAVGEEAAPR